MASKKRNPGRLEIREKFTEFKEIDLGPNDGWDTESILLGNSDWYEPYTDDLGRLFKTMQKEYGACVSKVYVDTPDGQADAIGWVFRKKREYEDADRAGLRGNDRFYTLETWVTYRYV